MPIAYLNGELIDLEQAQVSVLDRGFLFGDSLYEVFPVYHNKPFGMAAHLDRLYKGLNTLKLVLEQSHQELSAIISTVISKNPGEYQYIYIQILTVYIKT